MSDRGDSFLREVDEAVRQEHYKKLWDQYGIYALGLAVLVALNIADEFFRERDREVQPPTGELHERAARLERIVDEALAQVSVRKAV